MKLGYVGIGIMGRPMAHHLLQAGHELWVQNRTREKCRPLEQAGAKVCGNPAEAAKEAEVVFLNVPETADVEAVLFGEGGVAEGFAAAGRQGQIVVDNSTISPVATREFARRLREECGAGYVDAPVSGSDIGAKKGTLAVMAGGEEAAFEKVRGLLEVLGTTVVHVGPVGAGQMCKACNQLFGALHMLACAEGIALAERAGLDPRVMVEVVSKGASGSWVLDHLAPKIVKGDWAPGFMIDLLAKDLGYVMEMAKASKTALPGLAVAQQMFSAAQAQGLGRQGTQALAQVLRGLSRGDKDTGTGVFG